MVQINICLYAYIPNINMRIYIETILSKVWTSSSVFLIINILSVISQGVNYTSGYNKLASNTNDHQII